MAMRIEMLADDPNFLIWIGDGNKNWDNRGIFSITPNGDGFFSGNLSVGKSFVGMQSPIFGGTGLIAYADLAPSTSGGKRIVHVNLLYSNSGTTSTNITESLSAVLVLERAASTTATTWTELTQFTVNGATTSTAQGGNFFSECKLIGSFTYTDNNTLTNQSYRVRILSTTGTWPRTIGGSQGIQRLGVCSYIP